ncbi:hypothetical protein [Sphaerisporangium sp. NPDC051011]|uniref:hypothetical protein n=1 Tax=Sphaerisporangium sp. NPDC051011 TaxID=3155792 RepID=UPI0033FE56DC
MPMLEDDLQRAMWEETGHLRAAPDLAERVVRRARRRAVRVRVIGSAVAAVVAVSGAVFAQGVFAKRSEVAVGVRDEPSVVAGVRVRYVPEGLGSPREGQARDGRLNGRSLTWGAGPDLVRVTAYRFSENGFSDAVRMFSDDGLAASSVGLGPGEPATVRGRVARSVSGEGTSTLVWLEQMGVLTLRVTVGANRVDDLRRIADGLWVDPSGPAGGTLEGLRVPYLPEGVFLHHRPLSVIDTKGGAWVDAPSAKWTGENGGEVVLSAVRGTDARTLEDLVRWSRATKEQAAALRTVTTHGRPAYAGVIDVFGSRKSSVWMWVEKPGLGFLLTVTEPLAGELDRIAEAIVPVDDPVPAEDGGGVDGVPVTYVPAGLTRATPDATDMGDGWTSVTGRWSAGSGGEMRVKVIRGAIVRSSGWPEGYFDQGRLTDIGKLTGAMDTRPDGTVEFLAATTGNLAVAVTLSPDMAGELNRVVQGLKPLIQPSASTVHTKD